MTEQERAIELATLKEVYGEVERANGAGGRQLFRIGKAALPAGCKPSHTAVLLIPQPGRPQIYVRPGITLPNGRTPRSTTPVAVEGENWLQFSYSFPWDENRHSLMQFIEASLRRFGKDE